VTIVPGLERHARLAAILSVIHTAALRSRRVPEEASTPTRLSNQKFAVAGSYPATGHVRRPAVTFHQTVSASGTSATAAATRLTTA
jgi:hypothetical protein